MEVSVVAHWEVIPGFTLRKLISGTEGRSIGPSVREKSVALAKRAKNKRRGVWDLIVKEIWPVISKAVSVTPLAPLGMIGDFFIN